MATSITSIDLTATTYQNSANLTRMLSGYIQAVANFQGKTWAGSVVESSQITGRALDLAGPGIGTPAQEQALQSMIQYGQSIGVTVNIVVVPE